MCICLTYINHASLWFIHIISEVQECACHLTNLDPIELLQQCRALVKAYDMNPFLHAPVYCFWIPMLLAFTAYTTAAVWIESKIDKTCSRVTISDFQRMMKGFWTCGESSLTSIEFEAATVKSHASCKYWELLIFTNSSSIFYFLLSCEPHRTQSHTPLTIPWSQMEDLCIGNICKQI